MLCVCPVCSAGRVRQKRTGAAAGAGAAAGSSTALVLHVDQDVLHVYPKDDAGEVIVQGAAVLTLAVGRGTRRAAITSVKVELVRVVDIHGLDVDIPHESCTSVERELFLDLRKDKLDPGRQHSFSYSFRLPSSSPPSVSSTYGKVAYHVRASAKFDSRFSSSISSEPVPLWIIANSMPLGRIAPPLDVSLPFNELSLGPLRLSLASPHLTPSSLLAVQIDFDAPPPQLTVHSVTASIAQDTDITYAKREHVARHSARRADLLRVKGGEVWDGAAFFVSLEGTTPPPSGARVSSLRSARGRYAGLFKVDRTAVRPTTLKGSAQAPFATRHKLGVTVIYSLQTGILKRATFEKPVLINSCCASDSAVILPAYSKDVPKPATPGGKLHQGCTCDSDAALGLDELLTSTMSPTVALSKITSLSEAGIAALRIC